MNEKAKKTVLIVDDEPEVRESVKIELMDRNRMADFPYVFEVDVAGSAAECVEKVRDKEVRGENYDIIVLDILMEDKTSGLDASFALYEELGWETPIRIIFTGHQSYPSCVEAMRYGAWDYIVKRDVGDTPMAQIVVDSAICRLRQLDLRREQKERIGEIWWPQHSAALRKKFAGKLVALWHRPSVRVLTSGRDAFELEAKLKKWRKEHAHVPWEQPYIVQLSPQPDSEGEQS